MRCLLLLTILIWGMVLCPRSYAALVCDGVDDLVLSSTPLSSVLTASTGTFTVWVRPTGTLTSNPNCSDGTAIMSDVNGNVVYTGLFKTNMSGTEKLCSFNWTGTEQSVASNYTTNTWTHLTWLHSGGQLTLYKDGVVVSSSASGNTQALTGLLQLCGRTGNVLAGTIAQAQYWNVALTANEIASLGASRMAYLGVRTGTAYWPLDECGDGASGNGVSFIDRSGNGRTMTGNRGANATGLTCQAQTILSYPWGAN